MSTDDVPVIPSSVGRSTLIDLGIEDPDPIKAKVRFDPSELCPELQDGAVDQLVEFFYWVGVLPECPVEHVDLAGINFPKMNARIIPDPMRTGKHRPVPHAGAITLIDQRHLLLLRHKLPRVVIRFTEDEGIKEERGTGLNLGDLHVRPRRGHLITIPTPKEIEDRRKRNKPTHEYKARPGDRLVAEFIFAVLCTDQKHPRAGDFYPMPLATTGLEWPNDILE